MPAPTVRAAQRLPPGAAVLVPRWLWPTYACAEQGGAGWEAVVRSTSGSTAVVHFVHATADDGSPYADERLPLRVLQPLRADQQGR